MRKVAVRSLNKQLYKEGRIEKKARYIRAFFIWVTILNSISELYQNFDEKHGGLLHETGDEFAQQFPAVRELYENELKANKAPGWWSQFCGYLLDNFSFTLGNYEIGLIERGNADNGEQVTYIFYVHDISDCENGGKPRVIIAIKGFADGFWGRLWYYFKTYAKKAWNWLVGLFRRFWNKVKELFGFNGEGGDTASQEEPEKIIIDDTDVDEELKTIKDICIWLGLDDRVAEELGLKDLDTLVKAFDQTSQDRNGLYEQQDKEDSQTPEETGEKIPEQTDERTDKQGDEEDDSFSANSTYYIPDETDDAHSLFEIETLDGDVISSSNPADGSDPQDVDPDPANTDQQDVDSKSGGSGPQDTDPKPANTDQQDVDPDDLPF